MNVQKIFTKLRNTLNEREDKLLLELIINLIYSLKKILLKIVKNYQIK